MSVLAKLLEKIMNKRLMKFLQVNGACDPHQFGFVEKSGTESAIVEVIDTINDGLDKGRYVAAVLIDLKKAFDTVNHVVLLDHLQDLGIRGVALRLFRSYLLGRKVITKIGGQLSSANDLRIGVPQGSVLGPTLYLVYINNLKNALPMTSYTIYADDTIILFSEKTGPSLQQKMNLTLQIYLDWTASNGLTVNKNKTQYMLFKQKNKPCITLDVLLGGTVLDRVESAKYLGVIIDDKLSWNKHIEFVKQKTTPIIGALRRCKNFNPMIKRMISDAYIISRITYAMNAWSQAAKSLLNTIGRLVTKTSKAELGLAWDTPTCVVYSLSKRMRVEQMITYAKIMYIYKARNKLLKCNHVFTYRAEVHNYTTRHRHNMGTTRPRTNRRRNGLIYTATELYNKLPSELRSINSMHLFKTRLKKWIIEM